MPCPNCGSLTKPGAKFCGICGAPLTGLGSSTSPSLPTADPGPLADDPFTPLPPAGAPLGTPSATPTSAPLVLPAAVGAWPSSAVPSFRRRAWLTLALYFVFWLPGLIANLVWWREAATTERYTGVKPEGTGCLLWLLGVCGIGWAVLFVLLARLGSAG